MTTQGKNGRPRKPYETTWGERIDGLRRERSGVWRIVSTRQAFREPDERLAIQKFRAWQNRHEDKPVRLAYERHDSMEAMLRAFNDPNTETTLTATGDEPAQFKVEHLAPASPFWLTVRRLLIDEPQLVADRTGLPSIVTWAQYNAPKPSLKLSRIKELFKTHSTAKPKSIHETVTTFDAFIKNTKAETLADLTTETIVGYREHIRSTTASPATVKSYFGRVKNIIRFAKSEGEDAAQIDVALSRLAILKSPKDERTKQPSPISREHFHSLMKTAKAKYPEWQARMMLALNLCLHLDEVFSLQWNDFDLKAGTHCSFRSKTGVVRAAVLWPETIAMMNTMARTGPYVFTSRTGTRYTVAGSWKTWNKLRKAAGCSGVQFDDFRDGAYTAACNASGVDEKFARLLAGHKSHGLQDSYVQRNPAVVKPACEAVHRAYFG